jgi:glycosyltransferase involved in cell wall biosynthesis
MATIALAVICKDEKDRIVNLINQYQEYFDELAFAIDDQKVFDELSDKYREDKKVKLYKYFWQNSFSHKRNWLAERITSEFYFRCDTDDLIIGVENLRECLKKWVRSGYTMLFCNYLYAFDKSGNPTATHWRETVIKNDGNLFWNKDIHENINPKSNRKLNAAKETAIQIKHMATQEEKSESTERNLKYLLTEYEKTKDKPDMRTVGYIARMFLGLKKYKEAVPFFERFLEGSGWDDDKYFGWIQLAMCWRELGDLDTALSCGHEAIILNPKYPDAYFFLMQIYYDLDKIDQAIEWGKQGFSKPTPETMIVLDPTMYTWRPTAQLGLCYLKKGRYKEALTLLEKAYGIAPHDEGIKTALKFIAEIYEDDEAVKSYLRLMNYTKHDFRLFRSLVSSIPRKIITDERLLVAKTQIEPPKVWNDKSVVFYCGGAWEEWVDSSVVGGIGGSEEAVIYLSRELTKLGYDVTVFNNCGELAGDYKGVHYVNFHEFNPKDKFNILISWRHNLFATRPILAKKKLVWLHDLPRVDDFQSDELNFDKVIVLSNYHRTTINQVPDDKVYVSRNGINISDFENLTEVRNPKRCIWTSSYDRGLEHFLGVWGKVIDQVPEAELHIFYGWNTYDEMVKVGRRSPEFKNKMLELMKQKGVFEHGRIGHKKLAKEFARSGIYSYPTNFEEISCISAMKAQVAGAIPVVLDYAALKETVKFGEKVVGNVKQKEVYEKYAEKLVEMLKAEEGQEVIRKEMMPKAKELFSWEGVAKSWQADLFV